jgi:Zn-dependent alcohol dehydrogenase
VEQQSRWLVSYGGVGGTRAVEPLRLIMPNLLGRGIRLVGTNQGDSNPRQFLPRLIDLHRQGRLPFDRLIRSYAFDQINFAAQTQQQNHQARDDAALVMTLASTHDRT